LKINFDDAKVLSNAGLKQVKMGEAEERLYEGEEMQDDTIPDLRFEIWFPGCLALRSLRGNLQQGL